MLTHCSKTDAPWFVIPADDKWFARVCIAGIIYRQFEKLNLSYPAVDAKGKAELEMARQMLMNEGKESKDQKKTKTALKRP
jgi:hypothetical protein